MYNVADDDEDFDDPLWDTEDEDDDDPFAEEDPQDER